MTTVRKRCLNLRLDLLTATKRPRLCPISDVAATYSQGIDLLSQHEILKVLGRGDGGTVNKVRNKQTLAVYALKIIRGDIKSSQELDILRRISSPRIVHCHQIFEKPSGEAQILMEYMDIGTLDTYRKSHGHLCEEVIADISRQVLKGLVYMRSKNILHHDIKPSNLLINEKMEVKIIADFGISKIVGSGTNHCNSFFGTYASMSPERFDTVKNSEYDVYAADAWSFGVTTMEVYVGYYPFLLQEEKTAYWLALMSAICGGEPPCLTNSSSTSQFKDFINCCLQKYPRMRWTASQLLLHPFVAEQDSV
ncbi:Mitogen-activated protein kinase [Melia azedarach]|uniref:Mitogen-activated protein kinase n=1 Tax=Melia azedarach TaxID=155640 RepID=A0ACC1XGW8_MELAZ|nr:Mitogen-activated protein kinase [Melia azedarach]